MIFGRLEEIINNAKALSILEGFSFVYGINDNKEFVVELITGEGTKFGQLWNGIDGEGKELGAIGGFYKELTTFIKLQSGLPIDRVTLFQTGQFYDSFSVKIVKDGLEVSANTIKDGEDLQDRYGSNLLKLTDENKARFVEFIQDDLVNWLRDELLK